MGLGKWSSAYTVLVKSSTVSETSSFSLLHTFLGNLLHSHISKSSLKADDLQILPLTPGIFAELQV